MAKIKPFRAFIYNQTKIKDLSKVVCPPYDVISSSQQERYHNLNPYNMIHLILGKDFSTDNAQEDRYTRAARNLESWLKENILIKDDKPNIYFYEQRYLYRGIRKDRLGFIALLKLEDSKIFPHEHTRALPKEDRFKLLKQVKANLSPIFVLILDKKMIIKDIFSNNVSKMRPFISITDENKTTHRLWKVCDGEICEKIKECMEDKEIFIADGHHRYEVACAYREEMKSTCELFKGEEDFNYIMTYFTDLNSDNLTILPTHRLIFNIDEQKLNDLETRLAKYFIIDRIKEKQNFLFLLENSGLSEFALGIYRKGSFLILHLENRKLIDELPINKSKEYRSLGVSILNYLIFQDFFSLKIPDDDRIIYTADTDEAIEKVDKGLADVAFLLNPIKVKELISIVSQGERMPPKSTYFYPKLLSGLVINKFNEDKS